MLLDEVIPGAPTGSEWLEIAGLAYDTRAVEPGRCSSACPGSPATATSSRRKRSPAARWRWSSSAPSTSAFRRSGCRASGPRWRRRRRRSTATRPRPSQTVGVTGTNGKTTTAFLVQALLEADRAPDRATGHGQERDRRDRAPGGAHDARGDRPPADLPRDARRGRRGVRDGGLLARARPAPGRRDPLRGGDLHQPDPGPSRLPRHDGGVLPGQAPAVHRRASAARRDQRRRPVRRPAGQTRPPTRSRSRSRATPRIARATSART